MNKIFTSSFEIENPKKLNCFFLLGLMLLCINFSVAQSTSSFEKRFDSLKNSFRKETITLDSLKQILETKANEIDYAKKKNADENSIRKLMAGTVTVSSKIDEHQKQINFVEKELEEVKRILTKKYTVEIDSLYTLEKSNQYEGSESQFKTRILELTEKRVLAAPKINSLSFNPEKILEINISNAKQPAEKKIYAEYLTGALNEVNSQLTQVKKISDEIKQIAALQQKTKKFIEESEFDFNMKAANIESRNESVTTANNPTLIASDKYGYQVVQVQSFLILLKQLDIKQTTDLNTSNRFLLENSKKQFSIKEYRELLKEVEKRLNDYRLILTHKINATN